MRTQRPWHDLAHGITCIDAGYVDSGMACFYLLGRDGEYAVIETGTSHSLQALKDCLHSKGIADEQLRYVIPTHVHLDHAGGAGTIMDRFPLATLLVHPRGARHLVDPTRLVASSEAVYGKKAFERMYGQITPVPEDRVVEVPDGGTVELGHSTLEFRHTRGHADHHFCIWDALSRGWFTGDMFGISYQFLRLATGNFVFPATTPTQFNPELFTESVRLLESYSPQWMYLTHFGELAYTPSAGELLLSQVSAYAELAPLHASDHEAMKAAILACTRAAARRQMPEQEHELDALTGRLAWDMELNAQGLAVWLQKTGADRAKSHL